ncbi:hypothetical protein EGW08_022668 [Elysia chlorotica]|uniref:Uncharacterized protein n=1 Tax=Elysia chlorotica TaxID=188477 RepID=A0A3S1B1E8_ELYCH|nr:hypothetical protein EGW08_022668 [Elysia chlorotica]
MSLHNDKKQKQGLARRRKKREGIARYAVARRTPAAAALPLREVTLLTLRQDHVTKEAEARVAGKKKKKKKKKFRIVFTERQHSNNDIFARKHGLHTTATGRLAKSGADSDSGDDSSTLSKDERNALAGSTKTIGTYEQGWLGLGRNFRRSKPANRERVKRGEQKKEPKSRGKERMADGENKQDIANWLLGKYLMSRSPK